MSITSQRQIRENALEAQDFLRGLDDWRESIQTKDRTLLTTTTTREQSTGDGTDSTMTESELADELRNTGNVFFRDGNYTKAIELYTQSLAKHRTCVCLANRGMAFLKMQSFPEAELDCTEALKLDGSFVKAFHRRCVARRKQGKLKDALEDAECAMRLDPVSQPITSTFQDLLKDIQQNQGVLFKKDSKRQIRNIQIIPKKQKTVDGVVVVKQDFRIPEIPKNSAEFESAFKLLKKEDSKFSDYLAQIPPSSLPTIFKSSLTAPVLCRILESVMERVRKSENEIGQWSEFLDVLNKVQRFEMVVMCLTKAQKEDLRKCWNQLRSTDKDFKSKVQSLLKL